MEQLSRRIRLAAILVLALPVLSSVGCATTTKVSVYLLLRFVFTVFGGGFALGQMPLEAILLPLALYAFFAHVALVPIPQGLFVRLP